MADNFFEDATTETLQELAEKAKAELEKRGKPTETPEEYNRRISGMTDREFGKLWHGVR